MAESDECASCKEPRYNHMGARGKSLSEKCNGFVGLPPEELHDPPQPMSTDYPLSPAASEAVVRRVSSSATKALEAQALGKYSVSLPSAVGQSIEICGCSDANCSKRFHFTSAGNVDPEAAAPDPGQSRAPAVSGSTLPAELLRARQITHDQDRDCRARVSLLEGSNMIACSNSLCGWASIEADDPLAAEDLVSKLRSLATNQVFLTSVDKKTTLAWRAAEALEQLQKWCTYWCDRCALYYSGDQGCPECERDELRGKLEMDRTVSAQDIAEAHRLIHYAECSECGIAFGKPQTTDCVEAHCVEAREFLAIDHSKGTSDAGGKTP